MNALVEIRDGAARASSLVVADKFGKRHDHVMRTVRDLLKARSELAPNFGELFKSYEAGHRARRTQRYFEMDRKGFMLLVMGFTGEKALDWKIAFIDAFDRMETLLQERQPEENALACVDEESPVFTQIRAEDFDRKLSLAREIRLAYGRGAVRKMWNSIGLPPVEPDERPEYRGDIDDSVVRWLNIRTDRAPGHRATMAVLYQDYRMMMHEQGEDVLPLPSFGRELVRAGYPARNSNGAYRTGIRLKD